MDHVTYQDWHKSSYSNSSANCVEVGIARTPATPGAGHTGAEAPTVGVRDSKQHGTGPVLEFSATAWRAFTGQVKRGERGLG